VAILVTGGAGYIGSVTVESLRRAGESVVVLDNLVNGHRAAVPDAVPFHVGNVGDGDLVRRMVTDHGIDACIHFAAFCDVVESVAKPKEYYTNNLREGVGLTSALLDAGVNCIVFSSSCAIYGHPQQCPLGEDHPQLPVSPYGWTKFLMERMLEDFQRAYGLNYVALRYFNAAGATAMMGEDHRPETHLIPNVIAAAMGRSPAISVFGDDYPTSDGTAVRDYVHVADLGDAHVRAMRYLREGGASTKLNLGTGKSHSVMDVIETTRRLTGETVPVDMQARRVGDTAELVADPAKARTVLGWEPANVELSGIIQTAWDWYCRHPDGYGE